MINSGDLHNFGQKVSRKSDQNAYFKPRCIFWEHFYFSKQSPLYLFFKNQLSSSDFLFFENHFQLTIETTNNFQTGTSIELINEKINSQIDFYSFGMLTAYCTFFGIIDLHTGNVIYNGKHFIPIDIELVNGALRLPTETLLFPINDEERPYSVYQQIEKYFNQNTIDQFISGFYQMFHLLFTHTKSLSLFLQNFDFTKYPVRVIVMHTLKYKDTTEALIAEEKLQIERKDIPFFFKFINDNNMYYYNEKSEALKVKEQNERTLKKFNQLALNFNEILKPERLENLFINSNLYFAKIFFKEKNWNNYLLHGPKLRVEHGILIFEYNQKLFQAKV